ncbi:MAG: hypothetical protein ABW067_12510 [Rhizobacter sp.]
MKVASPPLAAFEKLPGESSFFSDFLAGLAYGLLPVAIALAGVWYAFGFEFLTEVLGGSVLMPCLLAVALGVVAGCVAASLSRRGG